MTVSRKLSVVQLHIREDGRLFPVYHLLQQRQAASSTSKAMTHTEDNRPVLPESLESIPKADYFPTQRHRWNTNEEIASILISFERHEDWLSKEVKIRPKSGSMLLYSRKRVRYRRDGYCWKKRKDGKTTREDHMKLKVQGTECIYGCYVHSAILPTFHRRCYWLLQNPDIVLVHYLNVPYSDDNKLLVTPSLSCCADKKEWTKEELVSQLKPMFYSENEPDVNNELEISTAETVEAIVQQLMEKQRAKSTARTHECPCDNNQQKSGSTASSTEQNKKCSHSFHRIISPKAHSRTLMNAVSTAAGTSGTSTTSSSMSTASTAAASAVATAAAAAAATSAQQTQVGRADDAAAAAAAVVAATATTAAATTTVTSAAAPKRATITTSVAITNCTPRHGSVILAPCRPLIHDGKHGDGSVSSSHGANVSSAAATSLILNLSQLQGGGGLLILNSSAAAAGVGLSSASVTPVTFLCGQDTSNTATVRSISTNQTLQTAMDMSESPATPVHQVKKNNNNNSSNNNNNNNISDNNNVKSELEEDLESALKRDVDFSNVPSNKDPDLCSVMEDLTSEPREFVPPLNFFEDTLAMSHDDIQKTLSANLPPPKYIVPDVNPPISVKVEPHHSETDPVDLNPMDFIDNDLSTPDEEVFNMDTFDILSDLPNLDDLNPDLAPSSGLSSSSSSTPVSSGSLAALKANHGPNSAMDYREGTANITDYSPDWCYIEGGVRVLVTGPWYSSTSPYTILFDGVVVPTTLVQSGVLRCFSPAHEPGLVTLQVACEGFVISNSVSFEYRQRQSSSNQKSEDYFAVEENTLKLSLLERLEVMECRLRFSLDNSANMSSGSVNQNGDEKHRSFEDRIVSICERLMTGTWTAHSASMPLITSTRSDLTLLHLAAALGFSRLLCTLLQWRTENRSLLLEAEVDAMSKDAQGCTPLMWACARGCVEASLLLYQWNSAAVKVSNNLGNTPLVAAAERGHMDLVEQIEKMDFEFQIISEKKTTTDELNDRMKLAATSSSSLDIPVKLSSSLEMMLNSTFSTATPTLSKFTSTLGSQTKPSRQLSSSSTILSSDRTNPSPKLESQNTSTAESNSIHLLNLYFSSQHSALLESEKSVSIGGSSTKKNIGTSPPSLLEAVEERKSMFSDNLSDPEETPSNTIQIKDEEDSGQSSRRDSCSSCDLSLPLNNEADNRVLTIAEHIIAAMPDRIKATASSDLDDITIRRSEDFNEGDSRLPSLSINQNPPDLEMCPLDDSPPPLLNEEFSFDHTYRYCEVGTPASSLSPASSSCLQSPGSFTIDSPSPPPTTADFCEFFQASGKIMEKDFSKLTLSDKEQRELYEAAKIIQKAYRSYKGRKKQEEQEKEKAAATLIQTYYRRYKQYMYYKQMTKAAQLIQNQFRNYCEHKRFKKWKESDADCISPVLGSSPNSTGPSAASLQSLYWTLAESERRLSSSREGTPTSSTLKRTYSQRRQHQAARKIQQFLRQSKNNLWDYFQGKSTTARTCISCRKREATGGSAESAASAPKIPGTAF